MTILWNQLALIEPVELSAFTPYIAGRELQRLLQFLMALCNDFEKFCIFNIFPSVDDVVNELLTKEVRLQTQ